MLKFDLNGVCVGGGGEVIWGGGCKAVFTVLIRDFSRVNLNSTVLGGN